MKPRLATDTIVIHCAATKKRMDIGAAEIRRWHKDRGWEDIGYHWVIRRNGVLERGRPEKMLGAHVAGHNSKSIGICLVGGLSDAGRGENNFTKAQMLTLRALVVDVLKRYPGCEVVGHRDLDRHKECPCFSVREWWGWS